MLNEAFKGREMMISSEVEERLGLMPGTIRNMIYWGASVPYYVTERGHRVFAWDEVEKWWEANKHLPSRKVYKDPPPQRVLGRRELEAQSYFKKNAR